MGVLNVFAEIGLRAIGGIKVAVTPSNKFAQQNEKLWATAVLRPQYIPEIDSVLSKLLLGKSRYEAVAAAVNKDMPWWMVCLEHAMEAGSFSKPFSKHLHCGDPLDARTVHVPAGRPKLNPKGGVDPPSAINPYSWEESAVDAMLLAKYDKETDWSLGNILWEFEKFNGLGYRHHGINTPYVWSYTNHYTSGKYIKDGPNGWSAAAVSKQPGCAAYLLRMKETHIL